MGDRAAAGGGRLAGQGHNRADLLGGEDRWRSRAWRIGEPVGDAVFALDREPAPSPEADRLGLDPYHAGGLAHAFPIRGQQDDPGSQGKLLRRAVGAAQPLQRGLLLGAQGDAEGGAQRHGVLRRERPHLMDGVPAPVVHGYATGQAFPLRCTSGSRLTDGTHPLRAAPGHSGSHGSRRREASVRLDPLALQLQGVFEMRLLRHSLMASSPDGPGPDERRLDPALG
jgi:hypothetical protein